MLKDVTLGQFFPGDTIVHRLDARTKLILVIVYIVGLFQAVGWVSYGAVTLATAACMWLSHISAKNIFKGLKPMLFIIVLTALLNIFYTDGTPINMLNLPAGCAFCTRCDAAMKICLTEHPEEMTINENHKAACWINVRDQLMAEGGEQNG